MSIKHKPVLGEEFARAILDRALASARDQGLAASVAIVDDGGFPLCLQRMDGAGLMTAKVALEKARTAALIRAPSRILAERIPDELPLLRLTDYLPMAGGLPIRINEYCVGGIGVSGGTADQDERTGAAGLEVLSVGD